MPSFLLIESAAYTVPHPALNAISVRYGPGDYWLVIRNEANAAHPHTGAFGLQRFGLTERGKALCGPTQIQWNC